MQKVQNHTTHKCHQSLCSYATPEFRHLLIFVNNEIALYKSDISVQSLTIN